MKRLIITVSLALSTIGACPDDTEDKAKKEESIITSADIGKCYLDKQGRVAKVIYIKKSKYNPIVAVTTSFNPEYGVLELVSDYTTAGAFFRDLESKEDLLVSFGPVDCLQHSSQQDANK